MLLLMFLGVTTLLGPDMVPSVRYQSPLVSDDSWSRVEVEGEHSFACAEGEHLLTLRWERACDSASPRENALATDTILIGCSQIKDTTTTTRRGPRGEVENLQSLECCKQIVYFGDCATWQEDENCATRGGRTRTALRGRRSTTATLTTSTTTPRPRSNRTSMPCCRAWLTNCSSNSNNWLRRVPDTCNQSSLGSLPGTFLAVVLTTTPTSTPSTSPSPSSLALHTPSSLCSPSTTSTQDRWKPTHCCPSSAMRTCRTPARASPTCS